MWQSRVEIGCYSVAYCYRVTAFKAPYLRTSVKGGLQTCYVNAATIDASRLSPAPNGSSEIRCFERSNAIEIRDGIISDFTTDCQIEYCVHVALLCAYQVSQVKIDAVTLFIDELLLICTTQGVT